MYAWMCADLCSASVNLSRAAMELQTSHCALFCGVIFCLLDCYPNTHCIIPQERIVQLPPAFGSHRPRSQLTCSALLPIARPEGGSAQLDDRT
jgi:hypothetical protein